MLQVCRQLSITRATLMRAEGINCRPRMTPQLALRLKQAYERAGVEFPDDKAGTEHQKSNAMKGERPQAADAST